MAAPDGFVDVAGHRLEYAWVGMATASVTPLVFLHEGLGSLAMWRDFPERVAVASGRRALIYSRAGYGASSPATLPRGVDYLHVEALDVLPALLSALQVERHLLVGHSDGASIALIHAGCHPPALDAVVAIAPHVIVETLSVDGIERARLLYRDGDLRAKLARYHRDVDAAFRGWNDIWLSPAFRAWDIRHQLAGLRCPLLLIQGTKDEYGSLAQLDAIEHSIAAGAERVVLAGSGHSPFRDALTATLDAVTRFLRRVEDH